MAIFYTSDWHFWHTRIIELSGRPFANIEQMNRTLLTNINDRCTEDDTLVILGDVALSNREAAFEIVKQINAYTILVPGNHDRCSFAYQRKGDRAAKVEAAAGPYREAFDDVWLEIADRTSEFPAVGDFVSARHPVMSHYPYIGDSHGDGNERYGSLRPIDSGHPLLHGHVHEEWRTRDHMFNVGVDVNDFAPVSIEEINAWLATL